MKHPLLFRLVLTISILLMAFTVGQSPLQVRAAPLSVVTNQKIAIPSYFYPDAAWTRLEASAPTVGIAIINPNSGPGTSKDPTYAAEIARAHAKGIKIIGYVHTSYGARAGTSVKAEVNQYYSWYHVDGIFFDEASTSCAKKTYYQALYNFVKTKSSVAKVIINPGTNTPECYITTADIIVNFEDNYSAYLVWKLSGWETKYPASRFWHLVIATPQSKLANAIALSKRRNAGWVYATPDVLNNPWDTLPPGPYWTSELNLVKQ